MGDYFLSDPFLLNLESQVTVDPLSDTITVSDNINTSNIQSSNADFLSAETYTLATTYGYASNIVASNVQTNILSANKASLCNLTFSSGLGSNLIIQDLASSIIDAYDIQTSILTCTSNLTASNLFVNYADATTILGSNIYVLSQILDRSNNIVIDSNSKLSWSNLKDIPQSNGLDIMALAQGAYDLATTGYELYQALKGLLQPTPEIPDPLKDSLNDALGSNDNGSSNLYVDWTKLTSVPFSTNGYDIGIQSNLYLDETNGKIFGIPNNNFSKNRTNVYATTASSNLVLDVGQSAAYLNTLQIYGTSNSGLTFNSNVIIAPTIVVNGLTVGQSNANVQTLTASNFTTSQAIAPVVSACNIQNYVGQSNGSNVAYPLFLTSSCNISLATGQLNYLQVSSSNFKVSESNLVFLQCTSNQNPFLTNSTTGLQINASNIILRNLNGSKTPRGYRTLGASALQCRFPTARIRSRQTSQLTAI